MQHRIRNIHNRHPQHKRQRTKNVPVEPGDLVLGKGGGDEGLLGEVLGDLDHLGLLSGEGVLDIARDVLEGVGLGDGGSLCGDSHFVFCCVIREVVYARSVWGLCDECTDASKEKQERTKRKRDERCYG